MMTEGGLQRKKNTRRNLGKVVRAFAVAMPSLMWDVGPRVRVLFDP